MAWSSFYGMQMKPGDILTQSQWNEHIRRTLDTPAPPPTPRRRAMTLTGDVPA